MWRGPQATSGTEARTRIVSNAGKLETFGPLKQILLLLPLWVAHVCGAADLAVQVAEPALWSAVLKSVGLEATLHENRFSIVVGNSPAGRKLGFRPTAAKVRVAQIADARAPKLDIYWQEPLDLPVFDLPPGARIFAQEKRTGAPLVAGLKQAKGAVLWVAAAPGTKGYERFPYLIHALVDLGLSLPLRSARTWAFFDYSYRTRADPDYLAEQWREAGIAALHVSAWHFHDPDPQRDAYLEKLIAACHRHAVLVYAWLELTHVSEVFWERNPHCREKTVSLQGARLDWRKLINLAEPGCSKLVSKGVARLLSRFDWDGVNLAELYFESLHGPSNPQRFTPMNDWVRADYSRQAGIDPIGLFEPESPDFWSRNDEAWQRFVDYRAELALRLQRSYLELIRVSNPQLDIVLTQIDDRFDTRMRELLGADTSELLPLAEEYDFQLVIEDPATLWNLGPQRYTEIAKRYRSLAPDPSRLAIDINIVERYQQTYPTKKQVGTELLQLVNTAGEAFQRVLLYFEHSIPRPDWALLPHASAHADVRRNGESLIVDAQQPVGVTWDGPALVNGELWPLTDGSTVWLPAGHYEIVGAQAPPGVRVSYLNGDLLSAKTLVSGVEFEYRSRSRSIALVKDHPANIYVDGAPLKAAVREATKHWAILLPNGQHVVQIVSDGLLPPELCTAGAPGEG